MELTMPEKVVEVDEQHVQDVSDAIEQLTTPMEKGTKEILTGDQRRKLNRLMLQLSHWIEVH